MENLPLIKKRQGKKTVLAIGEGETERIFIRLLVELYCRKDAVAITSSSAGGSCPEHIFDYAIRQRNGYKRDKEFILLDEDKEWTDELKERAKREGIELIGSAPCFESFLLEILSSPGVCENIGSNRCKKLFKSKCTRRHFDEDECLKLFPKSLLNSARNVVPKLDKIIKIIEGNF